MQSGIRISSQKARYGWRGAKPVLLGFAMFYLCFHVFHGERGLVALWHEQREQAHLSGALLQAQQERIALERRVAGLRSASLDRDLLDEQVRHILGLRGENEFLLFGGNSKHKMP